MLLKILPSMFKSRSYGNSEETPFPEEKTLPLAPNLLLKTVCVLPKLVHACHFIFPSRTCPIFCRIAIVSIGICRTYKYIWVRRASKPRLSGIVVVCYNFFITILSRCFEVCFMLWRIFSLLCAKLFGVGFHTTNHAWLLELFPFFGFLCLLLLPHLLVLGTPFYRYKLNYHLYELADPSLDSRLASSCHD